MAWVRISSLEVVCIPKQRTRPPNLGGVPQVYDVDTMIPVDGGGRGLLHAAAALAPQVSYFLPRNSSHDQVRGCITHALKHTVKHTPYTHTILTPYTHYNTHTFHAPVSPWWSIAPVLLPRAVLCFAAAFVRLSFMRAASPS